MTAESGADGSPSIAPVRACPICGRPASPDAEPFCSKRCADVDLHRWLNGVYAIPARDDPDEDEGADES